MKQTPVAYQKVKQVIDSYGLPDFGKATIREVVAISSQMDFLFLIVLLFVFTL